MSSTGFGYCEGYTALYAFDSNNESAPEYGVTWPAQTMPTDYFGADYPWSISMNCEVEKDSVQVKLVRMSDNKTWNFSNSSADGYFNVNNVDYGQSGCIIFRPNKIEGYRNEDKFQVTITGLSMPVSYQVTFFDLIPVTSIKIKKNDGKIVKGQEIYLESKVAPSDASNPSVKWTSSDPKIAKVSEVSEYGAVKAIDYGRATLTATSKSTGATASYQITVVPDLVAIHTL
ncbi:MAG: Ig-like domain-containing protein, partial [Acetivibrio sp.]